VEQLVAEQLPYALALTGAGLGWAVLLGIPLGCYSAIRRISFFDKLSGVITVGAIAVPSFVVALYALLIFAV
jgi:peptide/nickel transport system permease protein